jgi:hypothetical protein
MPEIVSKGPNFVDARRIRQRVRQHTLCLQNIQRTLNSLKSFKTYLIRRRKLRPSIAHWQIHRRIDQDSLSNMVILRQFPETTFAFGFFEMTFFPVEYIRGDKSDLDHSLLINEASMHSNDFHMAMGK